MTAPLTATLNVSVDDRETVVVGGGDVDSTSVAATDVTVGLADGGGDATVVVAGMVVAVVVVAVVVGGDDSVLLAAVDVVGAFTVVTEVFDALDEQLARMAVTVKTIAAPRN